MLKTLSDSLYCHAKLYFGKTSTSEYATYQEYTKWRDPTDINPQNRVPSLQLKQFFQTKHLARQLICHLDFQWIIAHMFVKFFVSVLKMKGASEETKMVLAAVDAGLKKLHTLDDSITLYEVINICFMDKSS